MNSHDRHELQQNYLNLFFADLLKKIEPHAKLIAVLFTVTVGAAVAFGLMQNSASMARSDATLELLQNANGGDAEALAAVGERFGKTQAGLMARLYEADTNLAAGITALYTDREDAETKINSAVKAYRDVALTTQDRFLGTRSSFGLGHALESLGKVEDAIAAYRQAISTSDSPAVTEACQQRIALLQTAETQEFLTWFAKQNFKPADPALPPSMPDGKALPELPDFNLPPLDIPSELKSSTDEPSKPAPGEMTLPESGTVDAKATEPPATATEAATEEPTKSDQPAVSAE